MTMSTPNYPDPMTTPKRSTQQAWAVGLVVVVFLAIRDIAGWIPALVFFGVAAGVFALLDVRERQQRREAEAVSSG